MQSFHRSKEAVVAKALVLPPPPPPPPAPAPPPPPGVYTHVCVCVWNRYLHILVCARAVVAAPAVVTPAVVKPRDPVVIVDAVPAPSSESAPVPVVKSSDSVEFSISVEEITAALTQSEAVEVFTCVPEEPHSPTATVSEPPVVGEGERSYLFIHFLTCPAYRRVLQRAMCIPKP